MILVTGGSGLVGRELISQLLLQGKQVTAIYNKTLLPNFNSAQLTQLHCNILDVSRLEEVMQGIDHVYHCAAIVMFSHRRKKEIFKINVEGTANIVNASLDAGVKKLVHVSSAAALGRKQKIESDSNRIIDEKMNWAEQTANTNYGKSKYLAEMEVWRGIGEGLDATIINPVIILGAGDWNGGSSKIFKTVFDEFPWYSDGVNGFVDVRDVAKAMIQLMESNISGERFIVSAANKSYHDIFNLIAKEFDKKPPYKKVTSILAQLIWRIKAIKSFFTDKDPLVTKETATTALSMVYYDNNKLKKFLPAFEYRSIEQTIADTCLSLKQKLNIH